MNQADTRTEMVSTAEISSDAWTIIMANMTYCQSIDICTICRESWLAVKHDPRRLRLTNELDRISKSKPKLTLAGLARKKTVTMMTADTIEWALRYSEMRGLAADCITSVVWWSPSLLSFNTADTLIVIFEHGLVPEFCRFASGCSGSWWIKSIKLAAKKHTFSASAVQRVVDFSGSHDPFGTVTVFTTDRPGKDIITVDHAISEVRTNNYLVNVLIAGGLLGYNVLHNKLAAQRETSN